MVEKCKMCYISDSCLISYFWRYDIGGMMAIMGKNPNIEITIYLCQNDLHVRLVANFSNIVFWLTYFFPQRLSDTKINNSGMKESFYFLTLKFHYRINKILKYSSLCQVLETIYTWKGNIGEHIEPEISDIEFRFFLSGILNISAWDVFLIHWSIFI